MATIEEERPAKRSYPCEIAGDVKQAVIARSVKTGVSINDVIVGELAAEFGVDYEPTGRSGSGPRSTETGVVQLRRMPPELRVRIRAAKDELPPGTKEDPVSEKKVVDQVLRRRLGLAS